MAFNTFTDKSPPWSLTALDQNFALLGNVADATAGSSLLGYKSSATGAVGRLLSAKLADVVSVKDFGATGDGVTDDSAAIQLAINAVLLASPYGELYFPRGTYLVNTSTLTINGPLLCKGVSRDGGTIIKTTTNARNLFLCTTATAGQVYGVWFEDIMFLGPGAGSTNAAIIFQHAWACGLNRCHIEGWQDGISFRPGVLGSQACDDMSILNSRIESNFRTDVDAQSRTNELLMQRVSLGSNCPIGVKIIDNSEPRIFSCDFRGLYTTAAIDIDEVAVALASNVAGLILANHFEFQTAGTNIRVGNTHVINGLTIEGNTFAGTAAVQPITATRADNLRVIGNLGYNWNTGTSLVNLGTVTTYTEENNVYNVAGGGAHGSGTPSPNVRIGGAGSNYYRQTNAAAYYDFRILNDQNSVARMLEFGYTGSAFAGAVLTDGPTGEQAFFTTGDGHPFVLGVNNRMTQYFDSSGGTHFNAETGLVAHAGGGQANALALDTKRLFHHITTCATAADSIKLPAATFGLCHIVKNRGAAAMQVFGTSPDTIDGIATGTGVSVPAGKAAMFFCSAAGDWDFFLGA